MLVSISSKITLLYAKSQKKAHFSLFLPFYFIINIFDKTKKPCIGTMFLFKYKVYVIITYQSFNVFLRL